MDLLSLNDFVRLALSHAEFSSNDDGSWTVEIPVLPGCVTWGETRAEAALMAEDAVQGWLVTALRFGDMIPVSVHKGRDIPVGTLASILKQADVSLEDWLEL